MSVELLTTGEIAKYCSVTDRAVLKWVDQGKIKSYKTPGRHSRVLVDDFIGFLKDYEMPIPEDLEKRANCKKKILIVEDDKHMVKTIRSILIRGGEYEVDVAYDGFNAGLKINEFKPDIITLDLLMPVTDGFEACQRIRENSSYDDVKILIISGVEDEIARRRIMKLGADEFMVKPISSQQLLSNVERLVNTKK